MGPIKQSLHQTCTSQKGQVAKGLFRQIKRIKNNITLCLCRGSSSHGMLKNNAWVALEHANISKATTEISYLHNPLSAMSFFFFLFLFGHEEKFPCLVTMYESICPVISITTSRELESFSVHSFPLWHNKIQR